MKTIVLNNLCRPNSVTRKTNFKHLKLMFLFGKKDVNGIYEIIVNELIKIIFFKIVQAN